METINETKELILNGLGAVNMRMGSLRVGQLISCFCKPGEDLFYLEDEILLERIEKTLNEMNEILLPCVEKK